MVSKKRVRQCMQMIPYYVMQFLIVDFIIRDFQIETGSVHP